MQHPRPSKPVKKVVVVDGEPTVRAAVSSILTEHGLSVTATDDIHIAIEICKTDAPHLVLTNVFLPGIPGHDAMKLLKQHCPHIPVLMMTGLPDDETVQEWLREDGFDMFPKPFRARDLVNEVDKILKDSD